jgi:hypothetical protein
MHAATHTHTTIHWGACQNRPRGEPHRQRGGTRADRGAGLHATQRRRVWAGRRLRGSGTRPPRRVRHALAGAINTHRCGCVNRTRRAYATPNSLCHTKKRTHTAKSTACGTALRTHSRLRHAACHCPCPRTMHHLEDARPTRAAGTTPTREECVGQWWCELLVGRQSATMHDYAPDVMALHARTQPTMIPAPGRAAPRSRALHTRRSRLPATDRTPHTTRPQSRRARGGAKHRAQHTRNTAPR